jgi:putative transposase
MGSVGAARELGETVGRVKAFHCLGLPLSLLYPRGTPEAGPVSPAPERRRHPRALTPEEEAVILAELNSERFQDKSVGQVYATQLDEGRYLASRSTQYRILRKNSQIRERRKQLRHPVYPEPKLKAMRPNQVWTWDITKLRGPQGEWYYLYVIIDLYSRYVVGWMVAFAESGELAAKLVNETCRREGIQEESLLIIHSDRGTAMTSKTLVDLLADLKIQSSYSRPRVSNDNPYSESQFKTMKYRPDYPSCFGSLVDARMWAQGFFEWYNYRHYHSTIGWMRPAVVHRGMGEKVRKFRQGVLQAAYQVHPERFVRGEPQPSKLPTCVWINPPKEKVSEIGNEASAPEFTRPPCSLISVENVSQNH